MKTEKGFIIEVLKHNKLYKVSIISMNEGVKTTINKEFTSIRKAIKHYNKYTSLQSTIKLNDFELMVYEVNEIDFIKGL